MNEELLAASALLVQNGAWLVSDNIKLVYGLQTVKNLVLACVTPAGTCNRPMLSQPKSAVHQLLAKLSWQIISGALPLFSGP
jgi:hypothetical protein